MTPQAPPFARGAGFGTLGSSFEEPTLPPAVSLFPATPGAWLTLGLALALLLAALGFALARYRKRAARRQAVRELRALRLGPREPEQLERLLVVLKGCALHSFERSRVAPLSGRRWLDFLARTAPEAGFSGRVGEALVTLSERGAARVTSEDVEPLLLAAERWVRRHRA